MINSAGKPKFFSPPLSKRPLHPKSLKAKRFEPPDLHSQDFPLAPHSRLAVAPPQHCFRTCLSIPTLSPPDTTEAPIGSLILLQLIKVRQHRMQLQKTEVIGKQLHNTPIPQL